MRASVRRPSQDALTVRSFVPRLEHDLRRHLAMLEREARAVRRALKALEDPVVGRVGRASGPDDLRAALASTPGTRASVLAVGLGRNMSDVRQELESLEADGIVERHGLGWRLMKRGADGATAGSVPFSEDCGPVVDDPSEHRVQGTFAVPPLDVDRTFRA